MRANFRESNPIPAKWAMQRLGLCGGAVRLPLVTLSASHHAAVEEALKAAGLLDAAGTPLPEAA
jgi:4-hydroxy-tetrahydrodipicolinate synthase